MPRPIEEAFAVLRPHEAADPRDQTLAEDRRNEAAVSPVIEEHQSALEAAQGARGGTWA